MDYTYYSAQPQAFPFSAFPPTSAHTFEPQENNGNDQADVYQSTNGYQNYDSNYQFAADGFLPPQQQQSPPISTHRPSIGSLPTIEPSNGVVSGEYDAVEHNGNRSSSEEKEILTPAQSRRKAQNRAAQRAFRERKERHVKDLELKLDSISAHSTTLLSDNERLKRELQRLATQNEILRATTAQPPPLPPPQPRSPSPIHGPQTYSPTDFVTAVGVDMHRHPLSYDSYDGDEGQRLLAAGATWDLIQSHDLFRRGMVDVSDVCRRLKGKAACDGRGPAFKESEVVRVIEESVLSGSDELI